MKPKKKTNLFEMLTQISTNYDLIRHANVYIQAFIYPSYTHSMHTHYSKSYLIQRKRKQQILLTESYSYKLYLSNQKKWIFIPSVSNLENLLSQSKTHTKTHENTHIIKTEHSMFENRFSNEENE